MYVTKSIEATACHCPPSYIFPVLNISLLLKNFFSLYSPQFGGQEPGSAQEVETWAREKYGASWNFMDKVRLFIALLCFDRKLHAIYKKGGCQRFRRPPPLCLLEDGPARLLDQRHQVELHQVLDQQGGDTSGKVWTGFNVDITKLHFQVWTQRQRSSHCGGRSPEAAVAFTLMAKYDHQQILGSPTHNWQKSNQSLLSLDEDFPERPRRRFV